MAPALCQQQPGSDMRSAGPAAEMVWRCQRVGMAREMARLHPGYVACGCPLWKHALIHTCLDWRIAVRCAPTNSLACLTPTVRRARWRLRASSLSRRWLPCPTWIKRTLRISQQGCAMHGLGWLGRSSAAATTQTKCVASQGEFLQMVAAMWSLSDAVRCSMWAEVPCSSCCQSVLCKALHVMNLASALLLASSRPCADTRQIARQLMV
jgi:hypothetical protein